MSFGDRRVEALDGLRGVAVLVVVAFHLGGSLAEPRFFAGGAIGVDLFFVLSGFLITSLLVAERDRTGSIAFGAFYGRRAVRLFPGLAAFLFAAFVYAFIALPDPARMARDIGFIVAYVFNWALASGRPPSNELAHLWSLSIEEQFYLAWPLVVLGLARVRPRAAVGVALGGAVASAALRAWLSFDGDALARLRTDARLDGLLLGAVVALLGRGGQLPPRVADRAGRVGAVVFAFFAIAPHHFWGDLDSRERFMTRIGYAVVALACAAMIAAIASGAWRTQRLLTWSPLAAVGRVSYGLYLWHGAIFFVLLVHGHDWPRPVRLVVALTLTTVATVASWCLVEQPAQRRWRRRFTRTPTRVGT